MLPTESISTWDLLKKTFIRKYCPPLKIAKKLVEIQNFKQGMDETLYQAWERYNDLLFRCSQHNLNNHQKVQIFYKGLDIPSSKMVESQGLNPMMPSAKALKSYKPGLSVRKIGIMEQPLGKKAIITQMTLSLSPKELIALDVICKSLKRVFMLYRGDTDLNLRMLDAATKNLHLKAEQLTQAILTNNMVDKAKNKNEKGYIIQEGRMTIYLKYIKDVFSCKKPIIEEDAVRLNDRCSTALQNQPPPKENDPETHEEELELLLASNPQSSFMKMKAQSCIVNTNKESDPFIQQLNPLPRISQTSNSSTKIGKKKGEITYPLSREIFNKWQAERWWSENCEKIMEVYNVQRFNQQGVPLLSTSRSEDAERLMGDETDDGISFPSSYEGDARRVMLLVLVFLAAIQGKRGSRQGDPLSPYLFTLVMEVLTLILQRRVRDSDEFQYHHLCEQQRIINLCFADDFFLFARGHPTSVSVIMDALDEFKQVSGLVPSIPKSTAIFCNVPNAIKASILNSMPFAEGTLSVRYLGVPLISSRRLYRDCKILVEKLESRVNDRRNKFLSLAGRLQLIRWDDVCPHKDMISNRDISRSEISEAITINEYLTKVRDDSGPGIVKLAFEENIKVEFWGQCIDELK
ncbi:putative reverse transcriptase domain, reverse transcriptase zinc-binding domain protein [Tanacetum coccineum]